MDLSKVDKIKINFIIGAGRSGTTLLVLLLNQNLNCVSIPEITHFLYFYKKYKNVKVVSQQLLDDYLHFLKLVNKSLIFDIFTDSSRSFFLNALKVGDEINYARLTKLVYLSFFEEKHDPDHITCIVDKTPFYTFHTDEILEIFPDAGFVAMVRDYRGYVLSNRQNQNHFEKVRSVFYYAHIWKYHVDRIIKLQKTHKERVLIVKYEEMVSDKEPQMKRIVDFLGLTYSDSMFELYYYEYMKKRMAEEGISEELCQRTLKKISDMSKPVNISRVDSWKTALTPVEMKKIEQIDAEYGKLFGYEPLAKQSVLAGIYYKLLGIPGYARVAIFFMLNSIKIHHYLNVVKEGQRRSRMKAHVRMKQN